MGSLLIFYLVFIHLFLAVALLKTDVVRQSLLAFGAAFKLSALNKKLMRPPYYALMVYLHQRVDENTPEHSIVFIGDSIIQGLAVSVIHPQAVNFGISGDTTVGVLNRIPSYACLATAKLIVIAVGINDLRYFSNTEILKNYAEIIKRLPEHVPVLFSAILPIDNSVDKKIGSTERIQQINAQLQKLCERDARLYFTNISPFLSDSLGHLASDYHIGDGVHPNQAGNRILIKKFTEIIQRIIQ